MNKEQAISRLILFKNSLENKEDIAVVNMAIKALTKEPTTKNDLGVDCISRADVKRAIEDVLQSDICDYDLRDFLDDLVDIPSVTPQLPDQERDALEEWIAKLTKECEVAYNKGYADGMKAQAEPKRGKWVHREDMDYLDINGVTHNHFMCNKCGLISDFIDGHTSQYNYCPQCGADMREVEE